MPLFICFVWGNNQKEVRFGSFKKQRKRDGILIPRRSRKKEFLSQGEEAFGPICIFLSWSQMTVPKFIVANSVNPTKKSKAIRL